MSQVLTSALSLDLYKTPLSRAGSYLALSMLPTAEEQTAGLYLRTLHGDTKRSAICRIEMMCDSRTVDASLSATPSQLTLISATAELRLLFADTKSLHCCGEGAGLLLTFTAGIYDHPVCVEGLWLINSFTNRMRYAVDVAAGNVQVELMAGSSQLTLHVKPDASGRLDFRLTEFEVDWRRSAPSTLKPFAIEEFKKKKLEKEKFENKKFEIEQQACATEFQAWLTALPAVSPQYAQTRELAAYVTWSALVAPQGYLQRPAMLMSKNWMHSVWSWDHCFNAMMLLNSHPALAWDQFMLPFDAQEEGGALPDCLNDKQMVWNFCKPPIHGWALAWMMRHSAAIDTEKLLEIYEPLVRWTQWWQASRSAMEGSLKALPYYLHGNDSGWDNCTLFDTGMPMHTPELAALLVIQLQTLADIATHLQRVEDSARWQQQSDVMLSDLLKAFWRADHFVARSMADGRERSSATLLLCMPLVLGKKLPADIARQLISTLQQQFLTEHGLATQAPGSPEYESDSYWRGPVWAPVVLMLVVSLQELGENELAKVISQRFCTTVARSGMAENFDALSGVGLRDPAHTWTASVFLLLAR